MGKTVDYYMTPVSPFTYLGHERLQQICAKHDAEIRLKLMDLGKVFPASGGLALKDRAPQRKAYRLTELKRSRDYLGLPLTLEPRFFPVPPHPASHVVLAVQEVLGGEAALKIAGACLRACWSEEKDISNEATLATILSDAGLDAAALSEYARRPQVAVLYDTHTKEAIDRSVFGAPTYVYNRELFWGQDRLDFLERALAK